MATAFELHLQDMNHTDSLQAKLDRERIVDLRDYGVAHIDQRGLTLRSGQQLHNAVLKQIPNSLEAQADEYQCILVPSTSRDVLLANVKAYGDREGSAHDGTGEWGHVLHIVGADHVTVRDCLFGDGYGDGCLIIRDKATDKVPTHVTIENSAFPNNRRNGAAVVDGDGIRLQGSRFYDTAGAPLGPHAGIDIEPDGSSPDTVRNLSIADCSCYNNDGNGLVFWGENKVIIAPNVSNLHSYGNKKSGVVYHHVEGGSASNLNTYENTLYGLLLSHTADSDLHVLARKNTDRNVYIHDENRNLSLRGQASQGQHFGVCVHAEGIASSHINIAIDAFANVKDNWLVGNANNVRFTGMSTGSGERGIHVDNGANPTEIHLMACYISGNTLANVPGIATITGSVLQ